MITATSIPFSYNFPLPTGQPGEALNINSPKFEVFGHTFNLRVYPNGNARQDYIALYLEWFGSAEDLAPPDVVFELRLCSGAESPVIASKDARHQYSSNEIDWGFTSFAHIDVVQEHVNQDPYVQVIITEISPMRDPMPPAISLNDEFVLEPPVPVAGAHHSENFFNSETFSDCKIALKDGTIIPGHRCAMTPIVSDALASRTLLLCTSTPPAPSTNMQLTAPRTNTPLPPARRVILANGSPVFAAMWTSGTKESSSCQVALEAEPQVATKMLRHMYGLRAAVPLQQLAELWMLADYYQVCVGGGGGLAG
jgi:hypothetical protein